MLSSHLLRNEGTSKHSAVMVCTRWLFFYSSYRQIAICIK